MTPPIYWYFDFISPFAYLQSEVLHRYPELQAEQLVYKPILFAGLLNHHGQLGPAEIPQKRVFTYRHVVWLAQQAGIPITFPPGHPFNPLKALRLAIACGNRPEAVAAIFRYIWREGKDLSQAENLNELCGRLGIADGAAAIADPAVKAQLLQNGKDAIEAGVFGVPTLLVNGQVIWGYDATEMAVAAIRDPNMLQTGEMGRVSDLPQLKGRI